MFEPKYIDEGWVFKNIKDLEKLLVASKSVFGIEHILYLEGINSKDIFEILLPVSTLNDILKFDESFTILLGGKTAGSLHLNCSKENFDLLIKISRDNCSMDLFTNLFVYKGDVIYLEVNDFPDSEIHLHSSIDAELFCKFSGGEFTRDYI